MPPSNAIVTGMNPIAERIVATITALYSALMIAFGPLPTRAKNVPITDARIEIPPSASGYSQSWPAGNAVPRSMTATAVTA